MTLSLGIDIGTSGVRTAVLDQDREVLSMARVEHLPQNAEKIDADLWWEAVSRCIKAQVANLKSQGRDPSDIRRIAVDGTSGTMVLTDADLRPVSPALMYNSKGFDAEATKIATLAPENHIARGSNSALARAMRLQSHAESQPAHLMHQADFIAAKLIGRGGVSDHNNALKTGFDPEAETWPKWIGAVIDPKLLPDAKPVGAVIDTLSATVATDLGLPSKAIVCAGTTDSIAAFLAAAPMEPGFAVTSLGSTLAVKIFSHKRTDDPAIGLYSHRLGDNWLVGGASNTGGAVLAKFFTKEEIATLSEQIDPGKPTGLNYYPLLQAGERFPVNDPNLQPKMEPRPRDDVLFLQAILEGIAAIEARCYKEIEKRGGGSAVKIVTAGGGAKNENWRKIRAARLGVMIGTAQHSEAAIGAASVAMLAAERESTTI